MKIRYARTISGLVVVRAELVGPIGPFSVDLAVDTGATRTVLDLRPLLFAGIDPEEEGIPPQRIITVAGPALAYSVRLASIRCLGRQRTTFDVAAHHLPPQMLVDGLLGLDFLGSGRLEFDFDAGTVALS